MDTHSILSTSIHFTPLLTPPFLWFAAVIGVLLLVLSGFTYRRGIVLRGITYIAFMLSLLNPSLLQEEHRPIKDVAVIVVDQSASQKIGRRTERTQTALTHLKEQIEASENFEMRIINAPINTADNYKTELFTTLDQTLADVAQKRRAGVIFLTDGQIHDAPKDKRLYTQYGPVHALLTGEKNEKDRQIILTQSPAYGLVGKDVTVKYRIEDTPNIKQNQARVTLTQHDGTERSFEVDVGIEQSLTLTINTPSQNVFSLEVEPVKNEITRANNKTAIIINGVRDRLKVLLVSGIPHTGERTWRDLLTSDPGVDLVHFTILREPQKFDFTPKNELSLIPFPFQELFEVKLYDFDLIIFDRYRVNDILPDYYFSNIVKYVKAGGAFLEASGPAFAGDQSIYDTPLGEILPGRPSGNIIEQRFKPSVTPLGLQHPVTKNLAWNNQMQENDKGAPWGSWMRYIDIVPSGGDVLLSAMNNKPLLVLDRVENGRVAQISSDHIWLWSRGYDGGGPHAELLRRIVHWLMKEPELDERALDVAVHKNKITLRKQNYTQKPSETIAMTTPNSEVATLDLVSGNDGYLEHTYTADTMGVYAFEDTNGTRKFAIIGDMNAPERRGIKTTADVLNPIVETSNGTTIWLDNTPKPKLDVLAGARRYGGSDWLALRKNNDSTITNVKDTPLLPSWVMAFILLSVLLALWWTEGRGAK